MDHIDPNHQPVLISESLQYLALKTGESVLDVTVGLGGHSSAFLDAIGPSGSLIAVDADSANLHTAQSNLSRYADQTTFIHSNFLHVPKLSLPECDCIFADLGLSSPHIDDPKKGFSFREDGPLDMRFNREEGVTAARCISSSTEEELANILYQYGEIRQSRKLAAALKLDMPKTTQQLCTTCEHIFGYKTKSYLPQVFQALRIAVNQELEALETLLSYGPTLLKSGGRLGIISFHSLEDRMVKRTMKKLSLPEIDDRTGAVSKEADFELITRKGIKPSKEEMQKNPRSRSAILRVLKKR